MTTPPGPKWARQISALASDLKPVAGGIVGEQFSGVPDVMSNSKERPRIEPLSYDRADEPARELWDQMRELRENAHHVPDVEHALFRTFMHHPDLFRVHSPFVQYLKNSTTLPVRHREMVILRSAWNCGVDDQWVNHIQIGLESGLSPEDIDRIPAGADAPDWSPEEAA